MSSFDSERQSILKRINSLESQNRVMRLLLITLCTIAIVGCSQFQSFSNPLNAISEQGTLEIEQLIVKDNQSNVRVKIDASDSANIKQSFYDEGGIERAQISIDEEGSARFRLFDTAGSMRFSAVTFSEAKEEVANNVAIALLGQSNEGGTLDKGGIYLTNTGEGLSSSKLVDNSGTTREIFSINKDGSSNHSLLDSSGNIRESFGVNKNNGTYLELLDKVGTLRHQINVFDNKNKVANQIILNSAGKVVLSNLNASNETGSRIYDNEGTLRESSISYDNGDYGHNIYDHNGTARHSFNTINNETNLANQIMFDDDGNIRQTYYTTTNYSGIVSKDREGDAKVSFVIDEDDILNYHREKSGRERVFDVIDGLMRSKDVYDAVKGSGN